MKKTMLIYVSGIIMCIALGLGGCAKTVSDETTLSQPTVQSTDNSTINKSEKSLAYTSKPVSDSACKETETVDDNSNSDDAKLATAMGEPKLKGSRYIYIGDEAYEKNSDMLDLLCSK